MSIKNASWNRNCPDCGSFQSFATRDGLMRAIKFGRVCKKCANKGENNPNFGKITTEEIKQKLSKSLSGDKNRNRFLNGNVPWNKGEKISRKVRKKISLSIKGKKLSSETKLKLRLLAIDRIKRQGVIRSFNLNACKFIEEFGKKSGYNFQHALNGGEIEVCGYFVDGYDKEKNVIFEYDEPHHYQIDGKLRRKDKIRQDILINEIKPNSFIRYDKRNNKLYDVITDSIISETVK